MPFNQRVYTPLIVMLLSNIPALVNVSTVGGIKNKRRTLPVWTRRKKQMISAENQDRGRRRGKTINRILSEDTAECRATDKGRATPSQVK